MEKVYIYDTTLRDGSQSEGVNFSLEDKLLITKHLDDFGIDYIEAGWPGSNPKDTFYFEKIKHVSLKHAKIVAFGSTRKKALTASSDPQVLSLLKAQTPAITIFGKSWDYHVLDAINTTLEENLNMIYDTISFLKKKEEKLYLMRSIFLMVLNQIRIML
jgi:Isopropylmalate/homocitrate/citramalate synthases